MRRTIIIIAAVAFVAATTFIYAGLSTLCDDDYWPDW
jgi:hypothetical protein